jgi:hypothetical protein
MQRGFTLSRYEISKRKVVTDQVLRPPVFIPPLW